MATPTLMDFLSALVTVERFLLAKAAELREKYPAFATDIDRLVEYLNIHGRTIETLAVVWKELEVLGTGSGPVGHDPVDLA